LQHARLRAGIEVFLRWALATKKTVLRIWWDVAGTMIKAWEGLGPLFGRSCGGKPYHATHGGPRWLSRSHQRPQCPRKSGLFQDLADVPETMA